MKKREMKTKMNQKIILKKQQKGGVEKMPNLKTTANGDFVASCQYCKKEMPRTPYLNQAKQWVDNHEKHCPENPFKKASSRKNANK